MDSYDDIPEEYIDILVQEFAYDPIRLDVEEDPAQVLYNRSTLERIWDTKHDAVNPYTRQPFDINNAIPHSELRQQMRQYILDNPTLSLTLGLEVIPDYTKVLSTREMKHLFNELGFHCQSLLDSHSPISNLDEDNKYWKNLWQKLNLLRLYYQYSVENKVTFWSIKGYQYLFQIVDEPLLSLCRQYYSSCEHAKEVCIELAKIVDLIGFQDKDLISLPKNCVRAFVRILSDLAESEYLKIQSMVLRIYRRMFYDCTVYSFGVMNVFSHYVVGVALYLLWRQNSRNITNEDLYNGMSILYLAWIKNERFVLDFECYVDVLVNVVIICITRLQDLNAEVAVHDGETGSSFNIACYDICLLSMALTEVMRSIDFLVTPDSLYFDEKEKLQSLDIIKEVVRIAELVESGFKIFEPIHLLYGLRITMALYTQCGHSVIRGDHAEVFGKLLKSHIVNEYGLDEYGEPIRILLRGISGAVQSDDSSSH